MCSRTRSSGASVTSCIMTPTWRRGSTRSGDRPNKRAAPESGRRSPSMSETAVDLPAPFGPSTEKSSPGRTCKSRPSRATVFPKRFFTPESSAQYSFLMVFLPTLLEFLGARWRRHSAAPARSTKHLISDKQEENSDTKDAGSEAEMQHVANGLAIRQQLQKQEKSLHNTPSFRTCNPAKTQPMTPARACGESSAANAECCTTRKQWR